MRTERKKQIIIYHRRAVIQLNRNSQTLSTRFTITYRTQSESTRRIFAIDSLINDDFFLLFGNKYCCHHSMGTSYVLRRFEFQITSTADEMEEIAIETCLGKSS